jgi:uncharacterized protein (DUF983 family)
MWRGVTRRCGRCGGRRVFRTYFQLHERCPRCGYQFEREEGFFTGVYLVNYAATAVLLVAEIVAFFVFAVSREEDVSFIPWLLGGAAIAVIAPIVLYPFAKSTWAAIDFAARPLDPVEEAEAAQHDRRVVS